MGPVEKWKLSFLRSETQISFQTWELNKNLKNHDLHRLMKYFKWISKFCIVKMQNESPNPPVKRNISLPLPVCTLCSCHCPFSPLTYAHSLPHSHFYFSWHKFSPHTNFSDLSNGLQYSKVGWSDIALFGDFWKRALCCRSGIFL